MNKTLLFIGAVLVIAVVVIPTHAYFVTGGSLHDFLATLPTTVLAWVFIIGSILLVCWGLVPVHNTPILCTRGNAFSAEGSCYRDGMGKGEKVRSMKEKYSRDYIKGFKHGVLTGLVSVFVLIALIYVSTLLGLIPVR